MSTDETEVFMGGYEQQIVQYSTGYAVCLGILIPAAALAVFFGIRFRIPGLAARMIGRKGRKDSRRKGKTEHEKTEQNTVLILPRQEKEYEKTAPIKDQRNDRDSKDTKGRGL